MDSVHRSRRAFCQVDVFGQGFCTGNPVAVVLDATGLDDATMRDFSAWTNLSECTFVLPPTKPEADYRVRIFSLRTEIPFAGHPTLGTARAWLDAGGMSEHPGLVMQECGVGLVPIRVDGENLRFAAPSRLRSGPLAPDLLSTIMNILGVTSSQVLDAEWLDNGPGWAGILLDSAQRVLELRPDASAHPGRWDIGVLGLHSDDNESALELRAFFTEGHAPLREDPVTGSLNAAAAEWLLATRRIEAPYVATQGSAVGSRGRITIDSEEDRIWVGGRADVITTGSLFV
jgi:PhzF family phenazine biosynthesis protein